MILLLVAIDYFRYQIRIGMEENHDDKKSKGISRRTALKWLAGVGGVALAVYYGASRKEISALLDEDKAAENVPDDADRVVTRKDKITGEEVSLLGFGCMRLPVLKKGEPAIDEKQAMKMIDFGYRHGINYFDTAYPYHEGLSETFVGKALKRYDRESFHLADKMPTWLIESLDDAKRIFNEQLQKCQVSYFDYYLLHSLTDQESYDQVYEEYGVLNYLKEQKAAGKIRRLGFSFHGDLDFFKYLLAKHDDWDFVQIQYNYYDEDNPEQNSGTLYKLLTEKGIQVIMMEPVKGGTLATLNKTSVSMLKKAEPQASTASWAIRFAATPDNVLTVLSGMSVMEQVEDNIYTMCKSHYKPISAKERVLLAEVKKVFAQNQPIDCTACRYCMPCPYGVDIPGVFKVYNEVANDASMPNPENKTDKDYDFKRKKFLTKYANGVERSAQADHCIACGKCTKLCPQSIQIPIEMNKIDKLVGSLQQVEG